MAQIAIGTLVNAVLDEGVDTDGETITGKLNTYFKRKHCKVVDGNGKRRTRSTQGMVPATLEVAGRRRLCKVNV